MVGGFYIVKGRDNDTPTSSPAASSKQSTNAAASKKFTNEEVAAHKTANDCWTIINGKVYDITKYVSGHPGGNEILRACGIDATTLFTTRTTQDGQKVGSGTPHSSNAQAQLDTMLIGTL